MNIDRNVLLGLLDKMDAPYMDTIVTERAVLKLKRFAGKYGIPKELTPEEFALLVNLEILEAGETEPEPEPDPAPKKTGPRMHWMKAATLALMQQHVIEDAEAVAVDIYIKGGGNKAKNIITNAQLYVSRAVVALETAEVIKISEDKKSVEFLV